MKIAVTGAGGFIGGALTERLEASGHSAVRVPREKLWESDLTGVDAVIHCAGLAHRSGKDAPSAEGFSRVNAELPVRLAEAATTSGVKRFVFVSTINVVAGNSGPLTPSMRYKPLSEYGKSKAQAEAGLLELEGIEIVIARPALVYGSGAPGNFRALMRLCKLPLPLPLGAANNQRSFLSITNASRALEFLAAAPSSAVDHKVFHLADPQPMSTAQIVAATRKALGRNAGLIALPPSIMRAFLATVGRGAMAEQLFGDMVVSVSDIQRAGFVFEDGAVDIEQMALA